MITKLSSEHKGQESASTLLELRSQYDDEPIAINFREHLREYRRSLRHGLYPYPARLLPHIPNFILSSGFVPSGSVVLDPFCGSGTVLVAAQEAGYDSIGFELNPVASLVARVKTYHLDSNELSAVGASVIAALRAWPRSQVVVPPNRVKRWYKEADGLALATLGVILQEVEPGSTSDALKVAYALTAREVSQTDPRIPVPVRPYKERLIAHDVDVVFEQKLALISEAVAMVPDTGAPNAEILTGDARQLIRTLPENDRGVVVVSSPPYGAAQKYMRSTSLESVWLGFTANEGIQPRERLSIGRERILTTASNPDAGKLPRPIRDLLSRIRLRSSARADVYAHYFLDMLDLIAGMATRPDLSRVCFVLGSNHVSGLAVETHALVDLMMRRTGFNAVLVLEDEIRGRTLLTARDAPPTKSEFVYFYER